MFQNVATHKESDDQFVHRRVLDKRKGLTHKPLQALAPDRDIEAPHAMGSTFGIRS